MAVEGVDYSWGRPNVDELYRLGKRFACRYVSFSTTGKNITRREAEALNAAGIAVVTNWENRASDQLGGTSAGRAHATVAAELHTQAGGPPDRPIYFSTDFDASPSQLEVCHQYLAGAAREIGWGRVGVYGGIRTIQFMAARDVRWLWQTYAWSGGRWDSRAHIRQYRNGVQLAGAEVDLNRATKDDFGQWGVEDMAIDKSDVNQIWNLDNVVKAPVGYPDDNPFWRPSNILRSAQFWARRGGQTSGRVEDAVGQLLARPPAVIDPVAFAKAFAANEDAVSALATAVAARVGMIPTAGEVARAAVDEYVRRLLHNGNATP